MSTTLEKKGGDWQRFRGATVGNFGGTRGRRLLIRSPLGFSVEHVRRTSWALLVCRGSTRHRPSWLQKAVSCSTGQRAVYGLYPPSTNSSLQRLLMFCCHDEPNFDRESKNKRYPDTILHHTVVLWSYHFCFCGARAGSEVRGNSSSSKVVVPLQRRLSSAGCLL